MADASTLYPTLSRNKNGASTYGSLGSVSGGTPTASDPYGYNDSGWTNGLFTGGASDSGIDTTVTGAGSSGGGGGWGQVGGIVGNLAPLALSLFAPKDQYNVPGAINNATKAATTLGQQGAGMVAQGSEALNPVLNYLAKVTSGDPQALIEATMPERRRVIDQYDTARQQAQFAPRGGGTSSAVVNANTREAGDLATLGAQARQEGIKTASALGTALSGQGVNAENASVGHLTQLLQPMLNDKQHTEADVFKTFASIAGLFALM